METTKTETHDGGRPIWGKEARLVSEYILARYICPVCNKRYGKPSVDGFIDIVRCDSCPKKELML